MSKPRTFKSRTNQLLKLAQNETHSVSNNNWLFKDLDKLNTTNSVDIVKNKKYDQQFASNKNIDVLCEYNLNTTNFERSLSDTEVQQNSTVLAEVLLCGSLEEKHSTNQLIDTQKVKNSEICINDNIISWSLSDTEVQQNSTVLAEVLLCGSPEEKHSTNQLIDIQKVKNSEICINDNIISWSLSDTEVQQNSSVLAEVLLCGSPEEKHSTNQIIDIQKVENSGICNSENISWLLNYVNHSQNDGNVIDLDLSVENQLHFNSSESNQVFNIIEPSEVNLLPPEIGPRLEISSEESENEKSPIKAKTKKTRKKMIHKKQWKQTIVKNLVSKGLQHTCCNVTKIVLNWEPEGKWPWGRPRKRWMDVVEKGLEDFGVQDWREIVKDRDKWSDFLKAVKTLG
ncbi:hypothetical protein ACI65C_004212 [Semiaphis heraclei]